MQPLAVKSFTPHADITIYTTRGEIISSDELTNSAITLQVNRSVDGTPGSFVLNLVASKNKRGLSWTDRIRPMDYIEIKLGNNNKPKMRMRGFVDSSAESLAMPMIGGPQRQVIITGRDYTKLPIETNIQYLWQNMVTGTSKVIPGLKMNYGIPAKANESVQSIIGALMISVFNGDSGNEYAFIPNFNRASKNRIPELGIIVNVPSRFTVWSNTIQPYTGEFWNLLTYYASAPLGEAFITDTDTDPVFVCRVNPFKDANGNYVSPGEKPFLPDITIDPSVVSTYNVGRLDEQVFNYFFAYADTAAGTSTAAPMYATQGILDNAFTESLYAKSSLKTNPTWMSDSIDFYGFRPLNIVTPWLNPQDFKQVNNSVQLATELSSYAAAVFGHNEDLLSGTLVCHGDPDYIPGRYATFNGVSYYLEKVSETFNFVGAGSPSWTAILTVTRGQAV